MTVKREHVCLVSLPAIRINLSSAALIVPCVVWVLITPQNIKLAMNRQRQHWRLHKSQARFHNSLWCSSTLKLGLGNAFGVPLKSKGHFWGIPQTYHSYVPNVLTSIRQNHWPAVRIRCSHSLFVTWMCICQIGLQNSHLTFCLSTSVL